MDLSAIQQEVLDYLDLADSDQFRTGELDRTINRAYRTVVNMVDQVAPHYNVSATVITLATPAASVPREYDLSDDTYITNNVTDFRKPVDCAQVVDGDPKTIPIISFAQRNAWLGRPGGQVHASPSGVYFYRTDAAVWCMGFVSTDPPESTQFQIRYSPLVVVLATSDNIPTQVPEQHHDIIAMRASLFSKMAKGRDMSAVAALYGARVQEMRDDLASMTNPPRTIPL